MERYYILERRCCDIQVDVSVVSNEMKDKMGYGWNFLMGTRMIQGIKIYNVIKMGEVITHNLALDSINFLGITFFLFFYESLHERTSLLLINDRIGIDSVFRLVDIIIIIFNPIILSLKRFY